MYMVFLKILKWHRMYYQINSFYSLISSSCFPFSLTLYITIICSSSILHWHTTIWENYHCHDHSVHPIQNSTVHILLWNIAMCDISSQYLILHIINRLSILFYTGNQVDIYINHKAYKKGYNIELSF